MAQKKGAPTATAGISGAGGRLFPPEAREHHGEVTQEQIEKLREAVGIDFSSDEWETIDGFGEVVNT